MPDRGTFSEAFANPECKKDERFFHQGSSMSLNLLSERKCNIQVHDVLTKIPWKRFKKKKTRKVFQSHEGEDAMYFGLLRYRRTNLKVYFILSSGRTQSHNPVHQIRVP